MCVSMAQKEKTKFRSKTHSDSLLPQSRFLSCSLQIIMENAGCVRSGLAPVSSEQCPQEGLSLTGWAGSPPEPATCAGLFSPNGHLREIFPPTEMSSCECGIHNIKFTTYYFSSIKYR